MNQEIENFNLRLPNDYATALLHLSGQLGCSRQEIIMAILKNSALAQYVGAQESMLEELKKILPEPATPVEAKIKGVIDSPAAPSQTDSSVPVARLGDWLVRVLENEVELIVQTTQAGVVDRESILKRYTQNRWPLAPKVHVVNALPLERFAELLRSRSWLYAGPLRQSVDGEIQEVPRMTRRIGAEVDYLGYWIYRPDNQTLYVSAYDEQDYRIGGKALEAALKKSSAPRAWSGNVRYIESRNHSDMISLLDLQHSGVERGDYHSPDQVSFNFVKYP
jgi:hypothetical protein